MSGAGVIIGDSPLFLANAVWMCTLGSMKKGTVPFFDS